MQEIKDEKVIKEEFNFIHKVIDRRAAWKLVEFNIGFENYM